MLAEAGLLDGRTATTHWSVADDSGRRYPAVRVNAGVLYVDEGDVVTSAETAAGLDCCLHLLRQQHGAEAALDPSATLPAQNGSPQSSRSAAGQ